MHTHTHTRTHEGTQESKETHMTTHIIGGRHPRKLALDLTKHHVGLIKATAKAPAPATRRV